MAGSKKNERRILQLSKYRPIAKVIQHAEAQSTVSKFIRERRSDSGWLSEEAQRLRERLANDDFERDLFDSNADYITRFASIFETIEWPKADFLPPGKEGRINLHGVVVTVGFHFRLMRTTKTNKLREGGAMLRYAKNRALSAETGAWQSAFILGFLEDTSIDSSITPEGKLCLTVDAWSGICHPAPSDAVRRYQNMRAACMSISEQWPNIPEPPGANIQR